MRFTIRRVTSIDGIESKIIMCGNSQIPEDEGNRHFAEYQAWLAEGNEPEEWSAE